MSPSNAPRLLLALIAGSSFLVPLFHRNRVLSGDWDYFNPLALVMRSCLIFYRRYPIHDPWTSGGFDLLSNPQAPLLSPVLLLNFLFAPQTANLLSLVAFAGAGAVGAWQLFVHLGCSTSISLLGAALFLNSSWFGLHFAEGHIAFESLQLLPWVLLFTLRLPEPRALFGLGTIMALSALDGGIYTLIMGTLVVASVSILRMAGKPLSIGFCRLPKNLLFQVTILGTTALLVSAKLIPVMASYEIISTRGELIEIPLAAWPRLFLWPLQSPLDALPGSPYGFHEFGCYFSLLGLALVAWAARYRDWRQAHWRWFALVVLWFWIGTGALGDLNPWSALWKLPFFNNTRIQSRLLLISILGFYVLCCKALERLPLRPSHRKAVMAVLLLESLLVKNAPFQEVYAKVSRPAEEPELIRSTQILETAPLGRKPFHYYVGNRGSVRTYEPMDPGTAVKSSDDKNYRGEVYFLEGKGSARLEYFIPGELKLSYQSASPGRSLLGVNTNFLGGWRSNTPGAYPFSTPDGLLSVSVPEGNGEALLVYRPRYLPAQLSALFLGIALWLLLAIHFRFAYPKPSTSN